MECTIEVLIGHVITDTLMIYPGVKRESQSHAHILTRYRRFKRVASAKKGAEPVSGVPRRRLDKYLCSITANYIWRERFRRAK